ncbi:hypothetical protein R1flu_015449 [Riccia fluitans]|uniref:Uncharacterized protein n=1 Tax=Riccia fluitans TaxID=41844 RepID=A0ABD1YJ76_9MARC
MNRTQESMAKPLNYELCSVTASIYIELDEIICSAGIVWVAAESTQLVTASINIQLELLLLNRDSVGCCRAHKSIIYLLLSITNSTDFGHAPQLDPHPPRRPRGSS